MTCFSGMVDFTGSGLRSADFGCGLRMRIADADCGLRMRIANADCGCGLRMRIADADCGCGLRMRIADCDDDDDKLYLTTLTLSAEAGFHNGRVKNINKLLQVK
jgi:hypothetical protein